MPEHWRQIGDAFAFFAQLEQSGLAGVWIGQFVDPLVDLLWAVKWKISEAWNNSCFSEIILVLQNVLIILMHITYKKKCFKMPS